MPRKKQSDRTAVLICKINPTELELVRKASELREQSMSGYVRYLVLNAARNEVEQQDNTRA